MSTDSLKLHRRARFSLWGLDPDVQERVRQRLAQLADLPRSEWPTDIVSRYGSKPNRYLVRVDDEWRLIVGEDNDGRPERSTGEGSSAPNHPPEVTFACKP